MPYNLIFVEDNGTTENKQTFVILSIRGNYNNTQADDKD